MWDWYLIPTAALYHTMHALEPVHVQFDYLKNTVSVYNDRLAPLEGLTVTTCEFQKADPTQFVDTDNDATLIAPRDEDGNLPPTTFAHLREGSFLIDAGTPVEATTYRGIEVEGISYDGSAPDLGAYEYDADIANGIRVVKQESPNGNLRLIQTQGSLVLLTVNGATGNKAFTATLCDASGRVVGRHDFCGPTTALRLPAGVSGLVLLTVKGDNGFSASVKALVR